jgi:hypothetical protein
LVEKFNLWIKNSDTKGANNLAPKMPNTMAASEVNSLTNPLKSPKTNPKVIGIKSNRSRVCIVKNI